ncbi:hypothetical protein ATKI12_5451 [Kitasatospora sp. Ki12]
MVENFARSTVKKPADHELSIIGWYSQLHQDASQPLAASLEA